jgi:hypothetical protein
MKSVTPSALWSRRFGSSDIQLQKTYRIVPNGIAVCFSCASFPTWNAWPSMMASLATGNPVIVKPHPATVLPMAITVKVFRDVLKAAGFDPNLVPCKKAAAPDGVVYVFCDSDIEALRYINKHPEDASVTYSLGQVAAAIERLSVVHADQASDKPRLELVVVTQALYTNQPTRGFGYMPQSQTRPLR